MADEVKGSGDGSQTEVPQTPADVPPPPKVPDVELIVDGFGFMPKSLSPRKGSKGSSTKALEELLIPDAEEGHSPCASSTNIDIVRRYTWKTKNRMTVQVITYGATFTCIKVPDRKGEPDDVIAGFDTLEEYFQPRNPYFGCTIGRCANIVSDGTMLIKPSGRVYMLSTNWGSHHFHGGYVGFDKVNWRSYVTGNKVIMSHVSERYSEGYPGTVMAQIMFDVTCDNTIKIEMKCTTSEPTIVNLTISPYFNLAGHGAGKESMYDHIVTINADKYTVTSDNGVVTGERKIVGGTPYDFRIPRMLRTMIPRIPKGGYETNYCITQGTAQDLTFHARALHPCTGRVVEVYSNQPGMEFYTGNMLPDPDKIVEEPPDTEEENQPKKSKDNISEHSYEEGASTPSEKSENGEEAEEEESEGKEAYGYVPLVGKGGKHYQKHGLFCVMPQNYPDAINHRNFPNPILNPGEVYVHSIQFKFGLLLGKYV